MIRIFILLILNIPLLSAQNFRVQIGAYADTLPRSYFSDRGVDKPIVSQDYMGIYHYFTGSFETREEAEVLLPVLKAKGFISASIIDLEEQRVLADTYCPYIRPGQPVQSDTAEIRVIYFDLGSLELNDGARRELNRIAEEMSTRPGLIANLRSHTDSQGDAMSNIEIATIRGRNVRNYLIGKGVRADRMFIKIFGEADPVAPNQDFQNRDLPEMQKWNRRVVVELFKAE